jgi:hypothetical protein
MHADGSEIKVCHTIAHRKQFSDSHTSLLCEPDPWRMHIEHDELAFQEYITHNSISLSAVALNSAVTSVRRVSDREIHAIGSRHGMFDTVDEEAERLQFRCLRAWEHPAYMVSARSFSP